MTDDPREPWAPWKARISAARRRRDDLVQLWQQNVDARRGKTSETDGGAVTVSINQDWPLTKAKIAQLYSQTPEVRLTPKDDRFRPAVPAFGRELNAAIEDASVGSTIEEVLADVVNASGIGGVLVSCETRTEPREVPVIDPATLPPDQQLALAQGMLELPTETVDHPVDIQHLARRISPADLLVPSDFTGSNYDHARWLGHDDRMTWAQAQAAFGLTDDQKDAVLGSDKRAGGVVNSLSTDTTKFRDTEVVSYTELFYWRHYYHPDETNFKALQRVVFIDGLDEPVVNEHYAGQRRTEMGLVGVMDNPIRVLTLTYISDDSLPPSDSSIGRFQVDELEESRDAMVQQRKHSIPIRWYDTNRVSPGTKSILEKGTYQGFIGVNGSGDRALGEVARASFPAEKFEFDRVIKNDLTEMWQVGTNQAGAFASGERSAKEAGIIQQNFQRRVGQEQDKVTRFFVGIAKVMAGHLALYGTFELPDELGQDRELIANAFTYSVRVDGTVRKDAQQRIEQLVEGMNITVQSGYVNPKPIVREIWELIGVANIDEVVIDPQPKPPEPVKVSVSKAEDLMNPLFLALLNRTQQGPLPEDLSAAMRQLQAVQMGMTPPVTPPQTDPNAPPPDVQRPGISNAEWEMAPRVDKRDSDGGA